jgi:two-component system sensor histidine kinase AlgZ
MDRHSTRPARDDLFLPHFCDVRVIFVVVLVGELLAIAFVLVPMPRADPWNALAVVSLFTQWVALGSSAMLCVGRGWLTRLGNLGAAMASYLIILALTAAVSVAVVWLVPLGAGLPEPAGWYFLARNLAVSAIVAAVLLHYLYVQYQWKTNLESEAQARVQALQSRIRPHFLFNSMNTIASLTRSQPEVAERAVEDLAELFRVSLSDARVPVTLDHELQICRQYLAIEALRLGSRLRIEWVVDELPGDVVLPALILQPLVENAIYHGIEPVTEGGVLHIGVRRDEGDQLVVSIYNPIPPIPLEGPARRRQGNRMAQDNVRERLRAFFGEKARLEAGTDGGQYRVSMVFPYRKAA